MPGAALLPLWVGVWTVAGAIGANRAGSPWWEHALGLVAGATGVLTITSYVVHFNPHWVEHDRWTRSRGGRSARWVALNGWRVGCFAFGLAVVLFVIVDGG